MDLVKITKRILSSVFIGTVLVRLSTLSSDMNVWFILWNVALSVVVLDWCFSGLSNSKMDSIVADVKAKAYKK